MSPVERGPRQHLIRSLITAADRAAVTLLLVAIRWYQRWLSPLLGSQCRFVPTCSRYMAEALVRYGTIRGLLKGLGRVCRCHPWSRGGHDPP